MVLLLDITTRAVEAVTGYLRGTDVIVQEDQTTVPLIAKPSLDAAAASNSSKDAPPTEKLTTIAPESKADSTVRIYEEGIYTFWEHQPSWTDSLPGVEWSQSLVRFYEAWPYFGRFLLDVYAQGPLLCVLSLVVHVTGHVLPTLKLMQASFMLRVIEEAFTSREVDRRLLFWALGGKILVITVSWLVDQIKTAVLPILETRVTAFFKLRIMSVQLRLDIPTSELPEVQAKMLAVQGSRSSGWRAFRDLFDTFGVFLEAFLQITFIVGTLRHQPGGTTIALLSLINPVATAIERRNWNRASFKFVTCLPFLRQRALSNVASNHDIKKEVIAYVMGDYIAKEYAEAVEAVGNKDDQSQGRHFTRRRWSLYDLGRRIASESSVNVLAVNGIISPGTTPLTSIALVQQTSQSMELTLSRLFRQTESIVELFIDLKTLYDIDEIENVIKDGPEHYPRIKEEGKVSKGGMKVQFKNVSFKYPHSDATAIGNLSFTIPAGSICVIVGENGCGKSSTLNLLNRLYDATEGEIVIDDLPIKDYKLEDLRQSTAIMFQDYHHFDLSLSENIGLGNVARAKDRDAVKEAAKLGAADEVIQRLPEGYDTVMNHRMMTTIHGTVPKGSTLEAMIKARREGQKTFSGGEKQRLALSRTFMRSTTCDTRLLAYDEPSAALDPKAEFALFERLRNLRGERTMVFVTHRFGYLTKYADLIIYMDKGRAVEQGSHDELLALDGQYAHLYHVQAQAFA